MKLTNTHSKEELYIKVGKRFKKRLEMVARKLHRTVSDVGTEMIENMLKTYPASKK